MRAAYAFSWLTISSVSYTHLPEIKDIGLIAAAQRVEHYEIAGYGCVRTYAKILGHTDAAKTLQTTLDEEAATDKKLTVIAEKLNLVPQEEAALKN